MIAKLSLFQIFDWKYGYASIISFFTRYDRSSTLCSICRIVDWCEVHTRLVHILSFQLPAFFQVKKLFRFHDCHCAVDLLAPFSLNLHPHPTLVLPSVFSTFIIQQLHFSRLTIHSSSRQLPFRLTWYLLSQRQLTPTTFVVLRMQISYHQCRRLLRSL